MANPTKFYLSHMHEQTKYRATWDPTKHLKIGDIGKLNQGVLSIYSSLEKEGIPIEVSIGNSGANMDYTSHKQVAINMKISGSAPLAGSALTLSDAGFSFEFKGDQGVVFQTGNHRAFQLTNLAVIEDDVLERYRRGNWDKDWVIVTELIEADAATIIISNSSNGSLELKAGINSNLQKALSLTDVQMGLSVVREKGSTLKYIAQSQLTPLYRVMGLRSAFLSGLSIGTRSEADRSLLQEGLELLEYQESELS